MRRFGPLQEFRQVLAVGDPSRQHLELTRNEIRYQFASEIRESYAWDGTTGIQLNLPTTWFRFPGAASGLLLSGIALFVQDDPHVSPKDGAVTISTENGPIAHVVSSHHLGGYWRSTVSTAQRLVDQLVNEPASRALLDHPEVLIRSASSAGVRGR